MATDMAAKFEQGLFLTIVEQCEGCDRVVAHEAGNYCSSYANPAAKWRLGMCNFATHVKPEVAAITARINPLKAAKRASKRK